MKKSTDKLIEKCQNAGILPLHLFDNILPVINGHRPASCMIYRVRKNIDYDQCCEEAKSNLYYRTLKEILGGYGVKVFAAAQGHADGNQILSKMYLYRGGDDSPEEVGELFKEAFEQMGRGKASELYTDAISRDGRLLGYPACCMDQQAADETEFINKLANSGLMGRGKKVPRQMLNELDPSTEKMGKQLIEIFGDSLLSLKAAERKIASLPIRKKLSYFANSFYPCRLGCENAAEMGSAILEGFEEDDSKLAEIYKRIVLADNILYIYTSHNYEKGSMHPSEFIAYTNELLDKEIRRFTGHAYNYSQLERISQSAQQKFLSEQIARAEEMKTRFSMSSDSGSEFPVSDMNRLIAPVFIGFASDFSESKCVENRGSLKRAGSKLKGRGPIHKRRRGRK